MSRPRPALRPAANAAASFLRAYWPFPLALVALLVTSDVMNVYRGMDRDGSDVMEPALAVVFASAGVYGGWRRGRVTAGIVAAAGSHVAAWTVMAAWWAATTYPFAFVQQKSAYWIQAWQSSARPGETFMHWIVWDNVGAVLVGGAALLLLSIAFGLVGGITGAVGRRFLRRPEAPTQ